MTDKTIMQETIRSPIDFTEWLRVATLGANWRIQLSTLFQGSPPISITANATLNASHNGAILLINSASEVQLTVPPGLASDFSATLVQIAAGKALWVEGAGVDINNRQGYQRTAGQYAVMGLIAIAQDQYVIYGDGV